MYGTLPVGFLVQTPHWIVLFFSNTTKHLHEISLLWFQIFFSSLFLFWISSALQLLLFWASWRFVAVIACFVLFLLSPPCFLCCIFNRVAYCPSLGHKLGLQLQLVLMTLANWYLLSLASPWYSQKCAHICRQRRGKKHPEQQTKRSEDNSAPWNDL